ncbi:MAG: CRISPR-associated endonuclease Cas6 [Bacteroidota bacterium]
MGIQTKLLTVIFSGELRPHEIPAFRGAIAQKVGRKHTLFHNHKGDSFRYGYPLIQYKAIKRQPALFCIGAGVEEIHHFFTQKDWSIQVSGRSLEMKIDQLYMNQHFLQVWEQSFSYRIHNWLALNQKSYKVFWEKKDDPEEQKAFLSRILRGNILSLAKGLDWRIDKEVKIQLSSDFRMRPTKVKGIAMSAFSLEFQSNVSLPPRIGLGRHVSLGYGSVFPQKDTTLS